jgi:hypothetical protein
LQQELAADALGARLVGGRSLYVRALSPMALRQEGGTARGLVPSFLSARGTLIRRIEMLRSKEVAMCPSARLFHWPLLAALVMAVIAVTSVRLPAQKSDERTVLEPAQRQQNISLTRFLAGGFHGMRGFEVSPSSEQQREPFDLRYLPPSATGIYAIRPAALLGRPEMKEYRDLLNAAIPAVCQEFKLNPPAGLGVEMIEQAVGTVTIQTDKNRKENWTSMMLALNMVRCTKEFDWKKLLAGLIPGTEPLQCGDKTYYKIPISVSAALMLGPQEMFYFIPDSRTVVFDTEENIRRLLERPRESAPATIWAEDWKKVERGLLAVARDMRDKQWLHDRKQQDEKMSPTEVVLVEESDSLVCGADYSDSLTFRSIARCANAANAGALARKGNAMLRQLRQQAEANKDKAANKEGMAKAFRFVDAFLSRSRIGEQGSTAQWSCEVQISLPDLIAAWAALQEVEW